MQGQVEVYYPSNAVVSNRPFAIQKLFLNRKPAELVQIVGLSYSLCGQAQKFAANTVLNQLSVEQESFALEAVMIETLREHLLSMVQMLVKLNVIEPTEQVQFMAGVGRWVPLYTAAQSLEQQAEVVKDIANEFNKLIDSNDWLEIFNAQQLGLTTLDTLPGLLGQMLAALNLECTVEQAADVKHLHAIEHQTLLNGLNSTNWNDWASKPEISNVAYENSAFTRVAKANEQWLAFLQQAPLKARLLARFVDVAAHLNALAKIDGVEALAKFKTQMFGKLELSNTETVAWVETARGRLYHFAQTQGANEPVQSYVISAPTEWNFHPQGVASQLINGLKVTNHEQWKTDVSMIAQIVDPCVPLEFIEEQMHA